MLYSTIFPNVEAGFWTELVRYFICPVLGCLRLLAPRCPIYQNVDAQPTTDPGRIKANLIAQLTSPVRWTQSIEQTQVSTLQEA